MAKRHGQTICIVDDDLSLRRSLRNLLMSVGFRVETFESVRMAGMNGLDLLRRLTAAGSRMPVIILTAHGDDETRRRSLEAGAVAFLEKPVRSPMLLDAVHAALNST